MFILSTRLESSDLSTVSALKEMIHGLSSLRLPPAPPRLTKRTKTVIKNGDIVHLQVWRDRLGHEWTQVAPQTFVQQAPRAKAQQRAHYISSGQPIDVEDVPIEFVLLVAMFLLLSVTFYLGYRFGCVGGGRCRPATMVTERPVNAVTMSTTTAA